MVQHFPDQPTVQIKHRDGQLRTVHLYRLRVHVVRPSPPSAPATPPSLNGKHHPSITFFEDDDYMAIGPPIPAPTRPVRA